LDLPGGDLMRELLRSSDAEGKRSTALTDLRWVFAVSVVALLVAGGFRLPAWIVTLFAVSFTLVLVAVLASHFIFLRSNPDLLRSESFTLRKMEIERGLLGDSIVGLSPASAEPLALPASMAESAGERGPGE